MRSEMLFTRCPVCLGSYRVLEADCPCTRTPTPGWAETGVTLGQLQVYAGRERALAGDPGLPECRRRRVLGALAARVAAALARLRGEG